MTLRRLASLALLTASLSFLTAGTTGCVVHSQGAGHPRNHVHHHCHNDRRGCHTHGHGPGHH